MGGEHSSDHRQKIPLVQAEHDGELEASEAALLAAHAADCPDPQSVAAS